jgi:Flp pilus assembly protein TadD
MSDPTVDQARMLLEARLFERARDLARSRLATAPSDPDAHLVAAAACFELGDGRACAEHAAAAIAADPRSAEGHRLLALALARTRDFDRARAVAAYAAELDPQWWTTHALVAIVELESPHPRLDLALRAAQEAVRLGPQEAGAHHVLGLVHLRSRRRGPAESALRTALAIAPQDSEIRWSLGEVLLQGRKAGQAIDEFAQLAVEDPRQRAHVHNVLVSLGNSLRFVYFAVIVPYVLAVRFLARMVEDDSTTVRVLLILIVIASIVVLYALTRRFVRRVHTSWRSLLRLAQVEDRTLLVWLALIGVVLATEFVAALVPDEAIAVVIGLAAIPTLASIIVWVVRGRLLTRRARELSG